jgi:hypothetical protein
MLNESRWNQGDHRGGLMAREKKEEEIERLLQQ